MQTKFERFLVPGLVVQSVLIGGSYATGREITEFFLTVGPFSGLISMLLTVLVFSACSMVAFELARRTRTFDYRSFCETCMGRGWFLFEIGYFATMTITLSVVAAASVEMLLDIVDVPRVIPAVFFMGLIIGLVYINSKWIERIMSGWSLLFYVAYAALFVAAVSQFGDRIGAQIRPEPLGWHVIESSLTYTGYNIAILPILIFVARHFTSRRDALVAGALAGPIILVPGIALFLIMCASYPDIMAAPVPISAIFEDLHMPWLQVAVQLAIIGMLIQTGVGLLHGANERIDKAMKESGRKMPRFLRPAFAGVILMISIYLATSVGIIDLVAQGFRYSTYYFLAIFVLPLMTVGLWKITRKRDAG